MILSLAKCQACRKDSPHATEKEISLYMPQIPEWNLIDVGGIKHLQRVFRFTNFVKALAFTNSVGELAEAEGHHPAILTEWGKVTVSWWTHKIKGLHKNDFVCAAKTDSLYVM